MKTYSPIGSTLQDVFESFGMLDEVVRLGRKKVAAELRRREKSKRSRRRRGAAR